VITALRPAFDATTQATILFEAAIPSQGTATLMRTVSNQVKTSFGPNLVVQVTPSATSYSIAWSGSGVQLSIDGGAFASPPASPIVVARNVFGGASKLYVFQGTLDGQAVTNTVIIPQQADKSTTKSHAHACSSMRDEKGQPGTFWADQNYYTDNLATLVADTVATAIGLSKLVAELVLPDGVSFTGLDFWSQRRFSDQVCTMSLHRITVASGSSVQLFLLTNNTTGSVQLLTGTVGPDTVDNSTYAYVVKLTMNSYSASAGSAGDKAVKAIGFRPIFTAPDLSKS
jgi:hypothetical protein